MELEKTRGSKSGRQKGREDWWPYSSSDDTLTLVRNCSSTLAFLISRIDTGSSCPLTHTGEAAYTEVKGVDVNPVSNIEEHITLGR